MRSFFYKVLEWTRFLFGIMPRSGLSSPTIRMIVLVVHFTFMILIACLLGWFSPQIREWMGWEFRMNENIPDWADRIWCGIMFVIVYCITRIVLYLMELMGIEEESDFPDIESDWHEILDALENDRLPIDDIPLFLVNGFTPQQEQAAFEAGTGIDWTVIAPPVSKKSTVLRAYANDDAIWLCCSGIGATNFQQGKFGRPSNSSADTGTFSPNVAPSATGTMRPGALAPPPPATGTHRAVSAPPPEATTAPPPPASRPAAGIFGTISPGGLKRAMESVAALRSEAPVGSEQGTLVPLDPMESMLGTRRMDFLCHLIQKARQPYCPINGMLQAVPFSWSESGDQAKKLVGALRDDLVTVHEHLELQFPVVYVVTALEDVSGVREFILRTERLQPGLRQSRAGSGFAAGADLNDKNSAWVIDCGMQWFRGWVYTAFSHDIDNRDNQKLFGMLCEINQRRDPLIQLLRDSLYRIVNPPPRLYGCYFSATGRTSTEQGYLRGVLQKLVEFQGEVAWAPNLIQKQKRRTTIAMLLWGGAVILLAATAWLLYNMEGQA